MLNIIFSLIKIQYGSGLENVTGKNESARKHYTQLKTFNQRTHCLGRGGHARGTGKRSG